MARVTPSPPTNLWAVLSELRQIINANSRHFLALSVLFLLPISICIALYPSINRFLTASDNQPPSADPDYKTYVLLLVAYVVIITIFNLLAIGSIVYSVFQGFYGRQVKFISAVKSSFASFFPLLATIITTSFIIFLINMILGFVGFLLKTLIEIIFPGLEISFLAFTLIVVIISAVVTLKFQLDWILSSVIVVVESVWGLTPLKRSKSLTKGMKIVFLSIIFFFAIAQLPLWGISKIAASIPIKGRLLTYIYFVVQIVIASVFLTFLALYNLAATTMMYMYCKDFHGEIDSERNYVSLPFDDDDETNLRSNSFQKKENDMIMDNSKEEKPEIEPELETNKLFESEDVQKVLKLPELGANEHYKVTSSRDILNKAVHTMINQTESNLSYFNIANRTTMVMIQAD